MSTSSDALVQWNQISSLKRSKLDELLSRRRELKEEIATLSATVAELDSKIFSRLVAADVKSCADGGTRITIVPPGLSTSFSRDVAKKELLSAGVDLKVVEKVWKKATTEKERSGYLKVTEAKEEKEEE